MMWMIDFNQANWMQNLKSSNHPSRSRNIEKLTLQLLLLTSKKQIMFLCVSAVYGIVIGFWGTVFCHCTCTLLFCGQSNATFFSVYKQISLQSFMFIQNLGKSNRRRGTSLQGTLYCKYFYMYFYLIFQCRQQLKKQKKHIFYNVCSCHEQFMFGTFYFAMGLSFILWKFINFQTCRVHLWVVIADGLSRWIKLQK